MPAESSSNRHALSIALAAKLLLVFIICAAAVYLLLRVSLAPLAHSALNAGANPEVVGYVLPFATFALAVSLWLYAWRRSKRDERGGSALLRQSIVLGCFLAIAIVSMTMSSWLTLPEVAASAASATEGWISRGINIALTLGLLAMVFLGARRLRPKPHSAANVK